MESKVIVHAQMPMKLVKEAKTYAVKNDLTISQILRMALANFLSATKEKSK